MNISCINNQLQHWQRCKRLSVIKYNAILPLRLWWLRCQWAEMWLGYGWYRSQRDGLHEWTCVSETVGEAGFIFSCVVWNRMRGIWNAKHGFDFSGNGSMALHCSRSQPVNMLVWCWSTNLPGEAVRPRKSCWLHCWQLFIFTGHCLRQVDILQKVENSRCDYITLQTLLLLTIL